MDVKNHQLFLDTVTILEGEINVCKETRRGRNGWVTQCSTVGLEPFCRVH